MTERKTLLLVVGAVALSCVVATAKEPWYVPMVFGLLAGAAFAPAIISKP